MLFKAVRAFLIFLLVAGICAIIFFPSLSRIRELRDFESKIDKKIALLDEEIKTLQIEGDLVQKDPLYKEYLLRQKLDLLKDDEFIVKIEEK